MAFDLVSTNSIASGKGACHGRRHRWGWGHKGNGGCVGGRGMGRHGACLLSEATVGDTVKVTGIQGDEGFRGRVMAMGILPGVTLKVVEGGCRRPLVVALPGSRCVVDQRSSEMIAVRGVCPDATREREQR